LNILEIMLFFLKTLSHVWLIGDRSNETIDAVIEAWEARLAKSLGSRPCDTVCLTDDREGFQLIPYLRAKKH